MTIEPRHGNVTAVAKRRVEPKSSGFGAERRAQKAADKLSLLAADPPAGR